VYRSLRHFLTALEADGQLRRIADSADPVLEIAEAAHWESRKPAPGDPSDSAKSTDPDAAHLGGEALLFESVEGSDFPVLINSLGSYRRMEMALGCHERGSTPGGFAALAAKIEKLSRPVPPKGLGEAFSRAREMLPLLKIVPKTVRRAPCQQVVKTGDEIDLTRLPILRCWPMDGDLAAVGYPPETNTEVPGRGHPDLSEEEWNARFRGRYITMAGIHTIHADDAGKARPPSHNIGMYRLQLIGKNRLAMHWHIHHDGAAHWRSWKRAGKPMPVAIALGGESVLPYAATCPLPPGMGELLMAGFLKGKGVELAHAKTVPLRVPAQAEIIIEGFVSTDAGPIGWDPRDPDAEPLGDGAFFEGPFGDHTGFYSLPDRYPVLEVTAITHRTDAIYPTTVVGLPPQEDYFMGKATERIMGALLGIVIHDIKDYDLPMLGAFHNCAFVQIEKAYPLQARRVMHAIWGTGQMAWTKSIFVVDASVDVHSPREVLEAAARFCRPDRDIERVSGPLDILDHAAPRLGAGTKIGFDCTPKWAGEEVGGVPVGAVLEEPESHDRSRAHLTRLEAIEGVLETRVSADAPGWLLVRIDRGLSEPDQAGLDWKVLEEIIALDPADDDCGTLPFVLVLGRDVDLSDPVAPFFHWLANSDPGRDILFDATGLRVGFACAPKTEEEIRHGEPVRPWPPVVSPLKRGPPED
jgi:4-hydroxy-3-polyprenylbenzoate decarboxylase